MSCFKAAVANNIRACGFERPMVVNLSVSMQNCKAVGQDLLKLLRYTCTKENNHSINWVCYLVEVAIWDVPFFMVVIKGSIVAKCK